MRAIRRQVHIVLDHLDKPENFEAMTFPEEVPQHFIDMAILNQDGKTTWSMEACRDQIAAETGKTFVRSDETVTGGAAKLRRQTTGFTVS